MNRETYYDVECYEESTCPDCDRHLRVIDNAKETFLSIVQQLYSDGIIDEDKLVNDLDQMSLYLGCKFIDRDLTIQRRVETPYINEWKAFNTQFLKLL